ncbi:cytochrome P450 [soil metagenome]
MPESSLSNEYDAHVVETFDSPHAEFARLRSECPVAHSDQFDGFWLLTRYADIVDVLNDSDNFITSVRNVVPGSSTTGRRPPLHLDPPAHTPYRKALERALSRARITALEPAIRRHAAALIDAFVERGEGDFVEHVSSPLPALVFGEWMGLTADQTATLWEVAQSYVKAWEAFDRESVIEAGDRLAAMAAEVIADRRANPRDPNVDPTSSLLASRNLDGSEFPEALLAGCVRQVLVVGLVAPPIVFGSIVVHLARHPELHTQLREDSSLIPYAIEEFFRLYTPYRGFARTSRTEVEIGGRTIHPGEPMALAYASANRDKSVFEDPDTFILKRPNIGDHIAFGRGPHRCVGMPVAKMEMTIALETLLARTTRIDLIGPLKMSGMPEVGPVSVPVRVVSASATPTQSPD